MHARSTPPSDRGPAYPHPLWLSAASLLLLMMLLLLAMQACHSLKGNNYKSAADPMRRQQLNSINSSTNTQTNHEGKQAKF